MIVPCVIVFHEIKFSSKSGVKINQPRLLEKNILRYETGMALLKKSSAKTKMKKQDDYISYHLIDTVYFTDQSQME